MPIGDPINKTGYVRSYQLFIEEDPKPVSKRVYFTVTISDQPNRNSNIVVFKLLRNKSSSIDELSTGKYLAVSYSAVHTAVIATIKDALIHQKKVTVKGIVYPVNPPRNLQQTYNGLRSVTMKQ
jgi:hypothetical protein